MKSEGSILEAALSPKADALRVEAVLTSLFGPNDGDPDIIYTLHGKRPRLRMRVRKALEAAGLAKGNSK